MNLTCPKCLSEAVIRLDVGDGETLTCDHCEESYTTAEIRAVVDGWSKLLPWLESHPARTEAAAATV